VDWITPWLTQVLCGADGRGLHEHSASEWVLTGDQSSAIAIPYFRDMQLS